MQKKQSGAGRQIHMVEVPNANKRKSEVHKIAGSKCLLPAVGPSLERVAYVVLEE